MGGLGAVELVPRAADAALAVDAGDARSSNPVIACLASQYAGWRLAHGEGKDAFFALGSGPGARAGAQASRCSTSSAIATSANRATLVLESGRPPPPPIVDKVAQRLRRRAGNS